MTNGLALSCLGGGRERWSMMSDMACEAWDRKCRHEEYLNNNIEMMSSSCITNYLSK